MLTWSNVAQLLARLVFDYKRIFIIAGLPVQVGVLILDLLKLLLRFLDILHELAIGPCLGHGAEQEGQANQPGNPDDGLGKERTAPGSQSTNRFLHTNR